MVTCQGCVSFTRDGNRFLTHLGVCKNPKYALPSEPYHHDPISGERNFPQEKYPGNFDAYPGTIIQDVLRVLINRVEYVNLQNPSEYNGIVIQALLDAFVALENRTRMVRNQQQSLTSFDNGVRIDLLLPCGVCGHVLCLDHET